MRAGRFQMQASAYYANRTPTLNELHRRFAVGNQITNANPLLEPETLTGVEGGVLTQFDRASVRATAFFNNLDGAIANVTLSQTPTQIIRQRQNSDTIRATGVEIESIRASRNTLSASGQIVFTSSHFRGSVATPALEDNDVPQVPKVQGGVALTWADPRWFTAATQVRFSGEQFDDDLNTEAFILGAYARVGCDGQPRDRARPERVPRRREHPRQGIRHGAHAAALDRLAAHRPRRRENHLAVRLSRTLTTEDTEDTENILLNASAA